MPPKPIKETELVKIKTCLDAIRNLCRKHHLDIWNKQSLSDLIYLDLLFIYHIPRLQREKILTINSEVITIDISGTSKLTQTMIETDTTISWYKIILLFETDELITSTFNKLWLHLQRSEVKELFKGRSFSMSSIEKDTKQKKNYYKLLKELFEYMASIRLESYESNAGYTYFKKELNKGTAKTFGQFYTPESVVQSVVNEIKPLSTETLLDPSSGSCSLIQGSAKFIKVNEKIDDNTIIFRNLYGIEVERNIYTEGIMSIFINFGILPDMKKNIIEEDAYIELLTKDTQYDVVVANPPFGADASTFSEFYYKTIIETTETKTGKTRNKKIININPEVKCKIEYPNTKESALLFWQIIVQKLKPGGRAGVVMSATLLNDSNADIIKWFLETCSLKKIIINPAGTFKDQGTSIETFSFIYTKGTPTTNVKIVMLGAEDVSVKELTLEQIREAGWKIKIKEDTVKEVYTGKFEYIQLDKMIDGSNGKNIPEEKRSVTNLYPYYASNGIKGYVDKFLFEGPIVLIGDQGSGWTKSIHYVEENIKIYAGNHTIVMKAKEGYNIRYIYYLLQLTNLSVFGKESAIIPEMNKLKFYSSLHADVPLPIQEIIVTNLNRLFANPQDMKEILAFTDRAMDLMLQDPTGAQLEDLVESIRLRQHHQTSADSVKRQMAAVMRSVSARGFEQKKMGDILERKSSGRTKSSQLTNTGEYPFYSCCLKNPSGTHNSYDNDETEYFLFAKSGGNAKQPYGDSIGIGKFYLLNNKSASSSDVCKFIIKDKSYINTNYINKILYSKLYEIQSLAKYTTGLGHIDIDTMLSTIKITIPPLPIQTEILAILNEMDAELKMLEQMAAKAEERARFILDGYLSTPVEAPIVEEETKSVPLSNVLTHEPADPDLPPDYNSMTRSQLLEECKKKNLKGVSSKKKEDLIKMLESS